MPLRVSRSRSFSVTAANLAKQTELPQFTEIKGVRVTNPLITEVEIESKVKATRVTRPHIVEVESGHTANISTPFIPVAVYDSKIYKLIHSKSIQTGATLKSFVNGPLRSNTLVTLHLFLLIAAEQKLIPALDTWPQAKAEYIFRFNQLRNLWLAGWFNAQNIGKAVKEVTWGHLGTGLRITAEMAAFYYIGQFIGLAVSLPFK